MPANILPLTKRYFDRAVYILTHTPPNKLLPLLNYYVHQTVDYIIPSDPDHLIPLLKCYLVQTYPRREVLAIKNFRFINMGWENKLYSFTAEWGPARNARRENLILRIYPGAFAQERAVREVQTLKWLYKTGYPVPRVYRFDPANRSPFGEPTVIMERIHGHMMTGELFRSTPDNYKKYLPVFCGLLARLHAVDWRSFVPNPEQYELNGSYPVLGDTLGEWLPFLESYMAPGFRPVWAWLNAHQQDIRSDGPVLVHQDFHGNNIIIKDHLEPGGEEAFVIDWTAATLADYRFDLARTRMLIGVTDGWHLRDPILREYELQTGKNVTELDFFDAFVDFLRLLRLVSSMSYGAEAIGLRAGTEEIMRRQAPSMLKVYDHLLQLTGIAIPEVEIFLNEAKV